ncbi:MAG: dTMP kinase [Bryobacteraceae bacterium]|nr:dTMP kinase [Bryobacteraceae bacterium]
MSTTSRRGLFLTFEGLDGCGKTTQMRRLAERLRAAGEDVVELAEPGTTGIGRKIRAILLDPAHENMSPVAEMLLYFAARAQTVDEILRPALEAGRTVLSDRWTDSTRAYQGYGRGLALDWIDQLDRIACRGIEPDLTLLVDIDVDTGLARARRRNAENGGGDGTRMDEQARGFYERVAAGYASLAAAHPRIVRVDGSGGPEEVEQRVWRALEQFRRSRV